MTSRCRDSFVDLLRAILNRLLAGRRAVETCRIAHAADQQLSTGMTHAEPRAAKRDNPCRTPQNCKAEMPHQALEDEQILILRLASSGARSPSEFSGTPTFAADIALLSGLGYVEASNGRISITELGRTVLSGVDDDWEHRLRVRDA